MPAEDHHILKTYFPASASYSFTFNVFFWSLICSWETSLLEQFLYHHMSWWALVANIEQLWYHFMNIWAALVIEHHVSWWEQWCQHMCCLVPPGPSALDTNCSCISGKRIEHVLWKIASLVDWYSYCSKVVSDFSGHWPENNLTPYFPSLPFASKKC